MTNVLILGANGQIAKHTEAQLLEAPVAVHQTLFLRNAKRLSVASPNKQTIIEGDATSVPELVKALAGIDIVYANLAGQVEKEATALVEAMHQAKVTRLIWISTLGIYDEVPGKFGEWNHAQLDVGYLEPYAAAAKIIEDSDLDYTIIRPAWLDNDDLISYETTQKGEPFKGTTVSRKSVAALVVKLISDPSQAIRASLGVNQPNTDGDKPTFY